jgi:hypothetical protein
MGIRRRWVGVLSILVLAAVFALSLESDGMAASSTGILPSSRPFPPIPSDLRDLKTALRKTDAATWEAEVGSYRSFYGWSIGQENPFLLHTGIEGNGYFTMRKSESKFPLESSDGLVGVYVEGSQGNWAHQLRFTHISAHLSDGSPDVTRAFTYSRETLSLRTRYKWNWLEPYAGLHVLVHTLPAGLPVLGYQLGMFGQSPWQLGAWAPYFGVDFRRRGGAEDQTLVLSAGMALLSSGSAPPIRLGANYTTGHDLRGQFFTKTIHRLALGLEMDIAI